MDHWQYGSLAIWISSLRIAPFEDLSLGTQPILFFVAGSTATVFIKLIRAIPNLVLGWHRTSRHRHSFGSIAQFVEIWLRLSPCSEIGHFYLLEGLGCKRVVHQMG